MNSESNTTAASCAWHRRDIFVVGLAILLLTTSLLVAFSHVFFGVSASWTGENGRLELAQQVLLAAAGLAFAAAVFSRSQNQPSQVRTFIFSALCLTFLLRETDVADPNRLVWLSFWLDETGKVILLIATWVLVLLFAASFRPWTSMIRQTFVFDATFWLLALAAMLLSVSWGIDREHLIINNHLLVEEASEVAAYGLMLMSALKLHPKDSKSCLWSLLCSRFDRSKKLETVS